MQTKYTDFLSSKAIAAISAGIEPDESHESQGIIVS